MTFTYSATNSATRDKVRRKIGDTQAGNPVFQDEELDAMLDENTSDVLLTAATAFREMAGRAARGAVIITLPGLSLSRVSQPDILLKMAAECEEQAKQRAEPDSICLDLQTDQLLAVSSGELDMNYDFTQTEATEP